MEDSALVGGNLNVAYQGGVAPDAERVIRKPARADNFPVVGAPAEAGDLGAGVDAIDTGTRGGVPEVDVAIVRTTTSGEKVHIPGAPSEGLDRSLVVGLGELRDREGAGIPDGDEVVIAASSELSTIRPPFEATDFGGVGDKLCHLVLGDTDIVVENETTPSSGRQEMLVPAHHAHACIMAEHAANLGALSNIPDLNLASAETDTNVGAITRPLDTADVGIGTSLKKTADTALIGGPDIDVTLKANSHLVAGTPVKEIEIVVINEARRIKHTLRGCGNASPRLCRAGRRLQRTIVLLAEIDRLRRLGRSRLELEDACIQIDTARVGQRILVGNGIGGWAGVGASIIVIDAESFKSGDGIISRRSKDRRALVGVRLGALSFAKVKLAGANIGDC